MGEIIYLSRKYVGYEFQRHFPFTNILYQLDNQNGDQGSLTGTSKFMICSAIVNLIKNPA